jgi:3-oxoacyl-[acyl-carrier protein] reductase
MHGSPHLAVRICGMMGRGNRRRGQPFEVDRHRHANFCRGAMNQLDLRQRVAIITGGARGIGLAVAERALRSGAAVSLWDIDAAQLEQAQEQLSALGQVHTCVAELSTDEAVRMAAQQTLVRFGRIDILVNNAGITGGNGLAWELKPDVWRRVIEVNLVGPYLSCRSVVPVMLGQGYGRIVNVASVAGKEGNPNASHYSASKAGLIGFTKSLAKELATRNILVNCVTPAAAKTELFAQMKQEHIDYMLSRIPMSRFVEPGEVAAMICWLASEDCSFTTGAVFDISGGRATY